MLMALSGCEFHAHTAASCQGWKPFGLFQSSFHSMIRTNACSDRNTKPHGKYRDKNHKDHKSKNITTAFLNNLVHGTAVKADSHNTGNPFINIQRGCHIQNFAVSGITFLLIILFSPTKFPALKSLLLNPFANWPIPPAVYFDRRLYEDKLNHGFTEFLYTLSTAPLNSSR